MMKFGYLSPFTIMASSMFVCQGQICNCIAKAIIYKKQHIQENVVFTIEYIVGSCNSSHQRMYINVRIITYLCSYVAMHLNVLISG